MTEPRFVSVSVGEHHLLALTSTGRTFTHPLSHKANSHGQLGMRHLEFPADGVSHTVDLVPDAVRDPYALSSPRGRAPTPRQMIPNVAEPKDLKGCNVLFEIPALSGIRISQIATGSRTSFVRTSDGRVLGWGANEFGFVISLSFLRQPSKTTSPVSFFQTNWARRERDLEYNHGPHRDRAVERHRQGDENYMYRYPGRYVTGSPTFPPSFLITHVNRG